MGEKTYSSSSGLETDTEFLLKLGQTLTFTGHGLVDAPNLFPIVM